VTAQLQGRPVFNNTCSGTSKVEIKEGTTLDNLNEAYMVFIINKFRPHIVL
jgi:hypothetical protein